MESKAIRVTVREKKNEGNVKVSSSQTTYFIIALLYDWFMMLLYKLIINAIGVLIGIIVLSVFVVVVHAQLR